MNQILYQTISVSNIIGCIITFVVMIRFVITYEVMEDFSTYYLIKLAIMVLVMFNNFATFTTPDLQDLMGWTLKAAGTLTWINGIVFCKRIKKLSTRYHEKPK